MAVGGGCGRGLGGRCTGCGGGRRCGGGRGDGPSPTSRVHPDD